MPSPGTVAREKIADIVDDATVVAVSPYITSKLGLAIEIPSSAPGEMIMAVEARQRAPPEVAFDHVVERVAVAVDVGDPVRVRFRLAVHSRRLYDAPTVSLPWLDIDHLVVEEDRRRGKAPPPCSPYMVRRRAAVVEEPPPSRLEGELLLRKSEMSSWAQVRNEDIWRRRVTGFQRDGSAPTPALWPPRLPIGPKVVPEGSVPDRDNFASSRACAEKRLEHAGLSPIKIIMKRDRTPPCCGKSIWYRSGNCG